MGWSGRAPAPPAVEAGKGCQRKEPAMSQTVQTAVSTVGIDIGKNSFHIIGHDERGALVLRQKWSRGQVETRLANMPPCLIGMEACVGAHHLSRRLKKLGHAARSHKQTKVRPRSYFGLRGKGMNPSRFGILTLGSDCASITSFDPT